MDSVFTEDTDSGLSDRLRANVSRFAAYKAQYVETAIKRALNDVETPIKDRPRLARAVLRTFARYQDAESSTAAARARTAKQFEQFLQPDNVRLFPNLKWLPSRSAAPRVSHTAFYNHVWPKDDPFWNTNAPGTEWNCKCDIEETDEPLTDNTAVPQPAVPLGLEGNPAQTGEVFTDNASYIRVHNRSNTQRRRAEYSTQDIAHKLIQQQSRTNPLLTEVCSCRINGVEANIEFAHWGISETGYSMMGRQEYWLKNEILNNPQPYFSKAEWIKGTAVDLSHNTGRTLRLKRKFQKYHYLKTQLADGTDVYLNIILHDNGKYYLYTISKNLPDW